MPSHCTGPPRASKPGAHAKKHTEPWKAGILQLIRDGGTIAPKAVGMIGTLRHLVWGWRGSGTCTSKVQVPLSPLQVLKA